jgi:hypothetical protein
MVQGQETINHGSSEHENDEVQVFKSIQKQTSQNA